MKIGITFALRNPPLPQWFIPWPEYYARTLDLVEEADRLGFHSVNFSEHHFDPDGYNPAIVPILTAVALRTKQARIGQNIIQMPFHHPVRLAEDLATIDILSGGRIMLGIGQGGRQFADEPPAFGVNPKHRGSLTKEGLEIIAKAWTEDVFSYAGRRWNLENVRVYPKPLQTPRPPIWVATNSDKNMEWAAGLGFNACLMGGFGAEGALGARGRWTESYARWCAAVERAGKSPADLKTNVFGTCFVTDDPEREWAKHREALFYGRSYRRFDGTQPYLGMIEQATSPEEMPAWQTYFRTPDDLVRHLKETFQESGPDELLIYAERPGIGFDDCFEYLALLAKEVLPHFQDEPVAASS